MGMAIRATAARRPTRGGALTTVPDRENTGCAGCADDLDTRVLSLATTVLMTCSLIDYRDRWRTVPAPTR
jgi:hypothetical protein